METTTQRYPIANHGNAFIVGFVLMAIITAFLRFVGFIRINPSAIAENLVIFSFWWLLLSWPIYKFNYFKRKRKTIYKILALVGWLFIAIVVDAAMELPDNPITVFFITSFWIGTFALIFPKFFEKYKFLIIGCYVLGLGYFTYVRLSSGAMYYGAEQEGAILGLVLPIPSFIVLWLYEQWKWLQNLKSEKAKAELDLLKSQINPHFFFNTLNNLYGLTVEKSEQAPEVILKLSEMMRYTIYEGQKQLVALDEEVAYLRNYIELHKIRYHKNVDITFERNIKGNYEITPLLFIILLENAFKHGVERLMEDAYIHIDLVANDEKLVFDIENNFDVTEEVHKEGIGLRNLRQRLDLSYKDNYELTTTIEGSSHRIRLEIYQL